MPDAARRTSMAGRGEGLGEGGRGSGGNPIIHVQLVQVDVDAMAHVMAAVATSFAVVVNTVNKYNIQ